MSAEHKKHNPGFLALVDDAKSRIRQVTIDDLARMLAEKEQFALVDVREESEWAAGHPAGAIHLSKGIIEREIETVAPDKGARMVLCCGGGYRSALSADALQKMGYVNVVSLDGGWRAYLAAGLRVEK